MGPFLAHNNGPKMGHISQIFTANKLANPQQVISSRMIPPIPQLLLAYSHGLLGISYEACVNRRKCLLIPKPLMKDFCELNLEAFSQGLSSNTIKHCPNGQKFAHPNEQKFGHPKTRFFGCPSKPHGSDGRPNPFHMEIFA
jgi:hypothetical protein